MNYYTYIIIFVTGHYYYGMRKCECLPKDDVYWGSPKTHKDKWNTIMYCKIILNTYSSFQACSQAEDNLISPVYKIDPFCLNMNCGGAIDITAPEIRAKLSASQIGEKNHNYGKKASLETRAKLSAAKKGKPKSAETRARMSAARKGRKHSQETKDKISATKKRKN